MKLIKISITATAIGASSFQTIWESRPSAEEGKLIVRKVTDSGTPVEERISSDTLNKPEPVEVNCNCVTYRAWATADQFEAVRHMLYDNITSDIYDMRKKLKVILKEVANRKRGEKRRIPRDQTLLDQPVHGCKKHLCKVTQENRSWHHQRHL